MRVDEGGLESAGSVNPRFPCVEGLRAVAALAVLVHHVAGTTGAVTGTSAGYIYAHLDVGVSVFFVLSGFLLYRPFAAAHLAGRPGPGLRRYTRRRFLRIFPAYWLALFGVLVLLNTVEADAGSVVRYVTLTQIYDKAHVLGGIVPAWSLATEISFYVALPFFALAVGRLAARAARPVVVEAVGVGLLWATGITVHSLLLATHDAATPATLWLPSQVDLFALGMLLAVASAAAAASGREAGPFRAAGRWPAWTWLLACVPFWYAATQLQLPREFGDLPKGGEIGRQICYGLTALLLVAPAVFGDQTRGWPRRLLANRLVAWIGLVSYGVFLWHFDLLKKWVDWGALDWFGANRFAGVLALTVGSALVVAWLSWTLLEAPLLGRRRARRVPARRTEPASYAVPR